jgi:hypothetical protein
LKKADQKMSTDTQTNQTKAQVETDVTEVQTSADKGRNYSFLHKPDSTFDAVETDDGEVYIIPAQSGSTYWAILRVIFEHYGSPMRIDDIIDEVAELLEDRDPDKWDRYKNKTSVTTRKDGQKVSKPANNWRKRLETNIKTLTRSGGKNPYGLRLLERGYRLFWDPNAFDGQGGILIKKAPKTDSES